LAAHSGKNIIDKNVLLIMLFSRMCCESWFFPECAASHVFPQNLLQIMFVPRICCQSCVLPRMCCQSCFYPECAANLVFSS
jgi:hypothetical protein